MCKRICTACSLRRREGEDPARCFQGPFGGLGSTSRGPRPRGEKRGECTPGRIVSYKTYLYLRQPRTIFLCFSVSYRDRKMHDFKRTVFCPTVLLFHWVVALQPNPEKTGIKKHFFCFCVLCRGRNFTVPRFHSPVEQSFSLVTLCFVGFAVFRQQAFRRSTLPRKAS